MPDVKQRVIRKNHAKSRPSRMLFLDTETKFEKKDTIEYHTMDFGWTCFVRPEKGGKKRTETWAYWNNKKKLCEYIAHKAYDKTSLYVFGHNVFFDLQVSEFFHWFTKWGWRLEFVYDKGLTYILVIKKEKRTIKCLSTTNYFPYSLKKLGELVDLPKLDVDFGESDRETLIEYCKRDTEIIKAAIEYYIAFIDKHDLGKFSMTKASQAFTAYRHRFMHNPICTHGDDSLDEFERQAYFGGRVEAFRFGKITGAPFVSLDINSMYPDVMSKFKYPVRYLSTIRYPDDDHLKRLVDKYCCVAEVQIETNEQAYPYRYNNKIVFPVGRFKTYLCTQGLKYAMQNDHLAGVRKIAVYERDHIFTDYVKYFYDLKKAYSKKDEKIMTRITKDFLNSLYGKFGQKKELLEMMKEVDYDGYFREETLDLVTGRTETVTKMFNTMMITYGSESTKNTMVSIAAHVTEYARFLLWDMMKAVGIENMLYCDTDSLKIRKKYQHKLNSFIHPTELGKLKIEEEFKEFEILGAKYYMTENSRKIKGIPINAEKITDYTYKYKQFPGQAHHLRKRISRSFTVLDIIKIVKPIYNKGIVNKDGSISPFHFSTV